MENNKTFQWILKVFFSLFLGAIIGAPGLAILPSLGKITNPLVCPQEIKIVSKTFESQPGKVYQDWFCGPNNISMKVVFYSVLCYSLLVFIFFVLYKFIRPIFKK